MGYSLYSMNFYHKHILPKLLDIGMKKKELEPYRQSVVREVSGIVLEIGFGSGLNLPYYQDVTKVYALDPSRELFALAEERMQTASFPIEHLAVSAEEIPLPDNSIDSAVSTWTLCSIPHPDVALREISRVLKPGGIFTFIEHGKSPRLFIAKSQNLLTPVTACVAGGCHLNRKMDTLIKDAGFEIKTLESFQHAKKPLAYMYKGIGIKKI